MLEQTRGQRSITIPGGFWTTTDQYYTSSYVVVPHGQFLFPEKQSHRRSGADVNNDGFVDLIIGNRKGFGQANQLLLNTGDAIGDGTTTTRFQAPINLPADDMYTIVIVAADVNNDGLVDLIIGNNYEANQLILNTGDAIGDGTTTSFQAPINLGGICSRCQQ